MCYLYGDPISNPPETSMHHRNLFSFSKFNELHASNYPEYANCVTGNFSGMTSMRCMYRSPFSKFHAFYDRDRYPFSDFNALQVLIFLNCTIVFPT